MAFHSTVLQGVIRPSDYAALMRPISPVFAFIIPWLMVLVGQQLALCQIIQPIYSSFYLIIFGNMVTSIFIAFLFQTFLPQNLSISSKDIESLPLSSGFKRSTYILIIGYLIVQGIQSIYFQGTPLIWLLTGVNKVYIDYGFSSLNGLLNALYLLITTLMLVIYLKDKSRFNFFLLILLISIPFLLVCRQLLMSVFIQIACCLLFYAPRVLKKISYSCVALLSIFIVLGNMRTGIQHLSIILGPQDYIPSSLYSLLWVYAYVVTPFNNINASMDNITPLGTPYYEMSTLVPSIFRSAELIGEGGSAGFSLVHEEMTVSSFYLPPLLDFGPYYAFLFMVGFQILLFLSYRRALKAKSWVDIVEYAVLYMVMVLSIFSNLLLYLPVIAQLAIIKIAKWRIYRNQGVVVIDTSRLEGNI